METIPILNEKSNVRSEIREIIRNQTIEYITSKTSFINGPNGLYLQIAKAQDGSPVYATLNLSISMADPSIIKAKDKKVDIDDTPNIPNLFNSL